MERELIVVVLVVSVLFVSLGVSAEEVSEEEIEVYSGFSRFVDNVRMFFSGGDGKVRLALEIREKEIDSAIVNTRNGDDDGGEKNLERAWERLQFIQEKVSIDTAGEVMESSNEIRRRIVERGDLSEEFEIYVLEEEKMGLMAELVVEVEGEEGQTLTREIDGDDSGGNKVRVVEGENEGQIQEQVRTREIETRIGEIDVEIKEWVVDSFDKTIDGDGGLTWQVANKIVKTDDDDGLTRDIKTYVAGDDDDNGGGGVIDDGPCKEGEENCDDDGMAPQGIMGNQGDGGMASGTSGTGTDDVADDGSGGYAPGTTADGGGMAPGTVDAGDDDSGGDEGGPSEPDS